MESVNLEELLRRSTPYERWRAPLDRRLRHLTILGGLSIPLVLLGQALLWAAIPFPRAMMPLPLLAIEVVGAAGFVGLLMATDALEEGPPWSHWAAFGVAALGALNALALSAALAGALLVLTGWTIRLILSLVGRGTPLAHLLPAAFALLVIAAAIWLIKGSVAVLRGGSGSSSAGSKDRPARPVLPAPPMPF